VDYGLKVCQAVPVGQLADLVLTPNGRFELNKKICISFTSYHEELWQPAWGVRTAIIGLQGFFPLKGEAAVGVGAIEYPIAERKRLATLSQSWTCPDCGQSNIKLLPDAPVNVASTSSSPSFQASAPENAGASSHPSLAQAHIPGSIPPLVKPTHEVAVADTPSVLNGMRPSSAFVDPVPDVVTRPILPVAPVATPLQLRDVTEEAEGSGARTPRAAEILSESRTPTPRPSPRPSEQALPAPRPVVGTAIARSTTRLRPPIWLDGAIAFFCFLIAYVAGRRVSHIWELVTEHV